MLRRFSCTENGLSLGSSFRLESSSATKFAVIAISEGLRQENNNIRVTVVSPGVTESELANSISDAGTREAMQEFRRIPLPAEAVSSSIAFALSSLTMLT